MPQPQTFQVTGVADFTLGTLTGTGANFFRVQRVNSSSTVSVDLNPNTVPAAANDTYTATLPIQSGTESATVTLTLIKGGSIGLNVSATTVYLYDPGTLSQQVTITPSPAVAMTYSTSVGYASGTGNWITVNPASGSLPAAGGAITIAANAAGLQAGTYNGTVTVTAGGASARINVSLMVGGGTGGVVTATPVGMSFAYQTGGSVPPSQPLYLYASTASLVTATPSTNSGTSWLLVNGLATGSAFNLGAGQSGTLQISVSPAGLTTGTHYGTITVAAGGTQSWVQITLNVNSSTGVSVSPTTMSFTSPSGANAQTVSVGYSGTLTGLTYTATPVSTGWLGVTYISNTVPGSFYVTVNAAGLIAGTYTGYVTVSVPGDNNFTQTITVTLTVGGGGGGTIFGVGPSSLTFNAQSGATPNAQPVAINGPANAQFTATSSAAWLVLSANSGVMPATLQVSVNPAAATLGTNYGTIQINSSSGSAVVSVTLNVQANPVLMASPGGLVITYDPASGAFLGQYVTLSSSASATTHFTYTVSTGTSWLMTGIFPTSGATDNQDPRILVVPTVTSLSPGANSGSITVTGIARNGGGTSVVTIPVTVVVTGATTGSLTFTPNAVTFSANQGVAPAAQSVTVNAATASTYYTVSATTASGGNWLVVSPSYNYTPSSLTVAADSAALAPGAYTGTVNVTANGVTQTIPVTLTVGAVALAALSLDNVALNFDYQQGGTVPSPVSLGVSSTGSQIPFTAAATVSGGVNWLSVSPTGASTPATLSVSVNPAGLAPGDYTGTITVTSSSASNSPQTRSVTLKVRAAPVLSLGVNMLTFTSRDGAVPGTQTFSVSSSGDPISFTATAAGMSWLTVSPASGTTPATLTVSVNPAGLAPRSYTGQIVVEGTGGNSSRQTLDVTLTVSAPLPTITRITNAASYREGPVSPGSLVVLFGSFMGPKDLAPMKIENGRCAKNLSDVRVLFSGVEAPLVYASADQVSAIVPYAMAGRSTTTAQVEYRGVRSNSVTLDVATTAPGIFTMNSSGSGAGVVLNQDFSLNSNGNAADRGSVIIVYATGEGQTVPLGVDGLVNSDPNNLPAPVLPVTATIDGQPAKVLYAGAAPGMVSGVMQLNIEVPVTSGTGSMPLVISAGGASSQADVTVAVK